MSEKKRKITSGTKEWADYNVNCIKGCSNNCRYCYAKMMGKRFGRCTDDTWKDMVVREETVNKKYKKYKGRVMFPSSHDIVDEPKIKEACLRVLENLLKSDNQVLVTTKPSLEVTQEIIKKFYDYQRQMQFRFTITSRNNELLTFWERNAPLFEERKESLILAYKEGFKTSVSIEPFLDKNPIKLVRELSPFITESIWIGPMNYLSFKKISNEEKIYYDEMKDNISIENLIYIYNELKDYSKIRFKDSLLIKIGRK